jgi:hypothetical protein
MILTVLEDATEVTQAVAEGAPIPVLQLSVQHLCPPVKVINKKCLDLLRFGKLLGEFMLSF